MATTNKSTSLNSFDLDFLLRQVEVGIDYTQLTNALDPSGVREVAGTNNNLVGHGDLDNDPATNGPGPNSTWGAADQPFLRLSNAFDENGNPVGATYPNYGNNPGAATVTDSSPRVISNLVNNSWTDPASPYYNPAAAAAAAATGDIIQDPFGNDAAFIPNVGPLGGSSYNNWFTFFGQFFDHGLDFIKKDGSSGFIQITLTPGDPLFGQAPGNVMLIARANIGNTDPADFDNGDPATGQLNPGVTPIYVNNTGLLVDQSQTYGSDPSVNALMHEYDANGNPTGRVVTGNTAAITDADPLNDGDANGLATWADIKINALRIGITLDDSDILDMRNIDVDAKGEIIRDTNGNAVFSGGRSGHPLLIDINPAASPVDHFGNLLTRHVDGLTPTDPGYVAPPAGSYDGDLLDAHFVVGDGRSNENFALTSVHHVWHEEHNLQANAIQTSIVEVAATDVDPVKGLARINAWLDPATGQINAADLAQLALIDFTDAAAVNAAVNGLTWNGEHVFQAARAITETEYNHVAIDEYIGRLIPDLPEFVSFSTDINLSVSLEFSQSIFRLGHSMLTENLEIRDANGNIVQQVSLFDAFLNPEAYAALGPSGIIEGAIKQLANEVDEFVTPALQQTLVGQPLDLAAINIARGRDVGLPTWNEFRAQVHDGLISNTNNSANAGALSPYTSWADVGAHLRNPETLTNLIAAYATTGDPLGAAVVNARNNGLPTSLADTRAAAQDIIDAAADVLDPDHTAAVSFLEGAPSFDPATQTWSVTGGDQGFWDIDLWVGGLAERPLIDGILGTTFSFVFLDFAQRMQDGDRFYYLFRFPPGASIGEKVISTKFSDIIARNSDTNDLNGDAFAFADRYFAPDATDGSQLYFTEFTDTSGSHYYFNAATALLDDADLSSAAIGGHIVISGGDGNDYLVAGDGDDTIHGGDGDDFIQGNQGNDHIFGGKGDDFIVDDENDDFICGGEGDDTIFAGKGALDTIFGDEGNDELHGGDGIDEVFGGDGDDSLFGDGDTDVIVGGRGNDYAEGGDSVDEIWGGDGNDILLGGVGDDHLNGDGGNDLLFGGLGAAANDGDRLLGDFLPNQAGVFPRQEGFGSDDPGFDIGSYENVGVAITADLHTSNQNGTGALIDTYAMLEGIVGTRFDDNITGAGTDTITTNGADNLLVGGAGNDILTGLSGNDDIVGDWVIVDNNLAVAVSQDKTNAIVDSHGLNRIDTGDLVPVGHLAEAHLGHVLGDNGVEGTGDVAVFHGDFIDYNITNLGNGWVEVEDTRANTIADFDGTDRVRGIEILRFKDGDQSLPSIANSAPVVSGPVSLPNLAVNTMLTITLLQLLANATDADAGDVLSIVGNLVVPSSGTIDDLGIVNGEQTWEFTPLPGDTSDVTFAYDVTDGIDTVAASASLDLLPPPGITIDGTSGADTLIGTAGSDVINAFDGADLVVARAGDDIINGGSGNDRLFGQNDDDTINGDDGDDQLFGQNGNDILNGGAGNDRAFGGNGDDVIMGDAGNDRLFGQGGNDIIFGGEGNDKIFGNDGNDILTGGLGTDSANGHDGDDMIIATLLDGNDSYTGGAGTDTYDLSGTNAAAIVDLSNETSTSADTGSDSLKGFENVIGTSGGDTIYANTVANVLTGGADNDSFVFRTVADAGIGATSDTISDFQLGDIIDLVGIDTFAIFAGPVFNANDPGQIMFRVDAGNTIVAGNTDNDVDAEFEIVLVGIHNLTSTDFDGVV